MRNPHGVTVRNLRNRAELATDLEIAGTHVSRLLGLLGRTRDWARLGSGLWIKPSRGIHTFGMFFPIDVILLDGGLRVVHLQENLRPFRISAIRREAQSVLELPVFTIRRTDTRLGDPLEIIFPEGTKRGTTK